MANIQLTKEQQLTVNKAIYRAVTAEMLDQNMISLSQYYDICAAIEKLTE